MQRANILNAFLVAALGVGECREAAAAQRANAANLAGRDHLGRELVSASEAGGEKGRQVGLFYYLWHGQHGTQGPFDVSKMLAADPAVFEKPDSPLWPDPAHTPMLHWGEPLFGYYRSTDEWVLRRHVQMFIDAGIDVLYFDTTNGYHYREVTDKLFPILEEYRAKGFKVPKFFYYMAPARRGCGTSNVRDVWDNYYSKGLFRDLWFEWDGKPLIVTHPDRPYPQALLDAFTFRRPTWGTPSAPDTWYWGGMPGQNVSVSSSGRREMLPVTVGSPHIAPAAPPSRLRRLRHLRERHRRERIRLPPRGGWRGWHDPVHGRNREASPHCGRKEHEPPSARSGAPGRCDGLHARIHAGKRHLRKRGAAGGVLRERGEAGDRRLPALHIGIQVVGQPEGRRPHGLLRQWRRRPSRPDELALRLRAVNLKGPPSRPGGGGNSLQNPKERTSK